MKRNAAEFGPEIEASVRALRDGMNLQDFTPDDFTAAFNLLEGLLKNVSRIAQALETIARQEPG